MKKIILCILIPVSVIGALSGQKKNKGAVEALRDFEFCVAKVKADYPGYADKHTPQLDLLEAGLRARVPLHPDSCLSYMQQYMDYFNDNHLWVLYSKEYAEELYEQEEEEESEPIMVTLPENVEKLNREGSIEGLWTLWYERRFAIIPADKPGTYTGMWLESGDGNGRYEKFCDFTHEADSLYSVTYPDSDYVGKATLELGGTVLDMHRTNIRLVHPSGDPAWDEAFIQAYVPSTQSGINIWEAYSSLDENTFFIRISGFEYEECEEIEQALEFNWEAITKRPNLIIDLRFNGGGSDYCWEKLHSLIYSSPYTSKGVEYYATPGNIATIEKEITESADDGEVDEEYRQWRLTLLEGMKRNKGGWYTPEDYDADGCWTREYDTVYTYPKRIGIIINHWCGSSTEQLLLEAKKSDKKVILFGNENTTGTLDYSNVFVHEFPSGRYEAYIPMTRTLRPAEERIDGKGIAPDIMVPFPENRRLDDKADLWVQFVKEYLNYLQEHEEGGEEE